MIYVVMYLTDSDEATVRTNVRLRMAFSDKRSAAQLRDEVGTSSLSKACVGAFKAVMKCHVMRVFVQSLLPAH